MQPPEWKGATSQRFSGGRIHLKPHDELNTLMQSNSMTQPLGVKTYGERLSDEKQFRPCLRIHEDSYNLKQKEIDLRGIKHCTLPPQPERVRR